MARDYFWTKRETTILIDLWKSCPILYDYSMESDESKQVRNKTMDFIIKELEKVGISKTVVEVKGKIRTLQSQLSKERKKIKLAKDYVPRLWCFNELSFLCPSFSFDTNEEQNISSDSSDHHHCPATPSVGHRAENSSDIKTKNSLDEVEPMEELEAEDDKWSKNEATILINSWKSHPILYDSSMTNYTNKKLRNNTLDDMVKELGKVGIRKTVVQLKNKLRTLQSQICREKKKIRLYKDYESKLWCFNELSFLMPSSFSHNATKKNFGEVHDISSISSDNRIKNRLDVIKPMEELETEETIQTLFSYSSNDNIPLKNYKQNNEVTKIADDSKEINKNNNLIKEYIESFSEFDEVETPFNHTFRNDTSVKSIKKKEITHMLEVPKTANSATILTNIQSEKKLEERQEAFCKYLAIELKQIISDDLFDELKLEILQLVSKKIKHQSNILPEDHPINIKDYISFIS